MANPLSDYRALAGVVAIRSPRGREWQTHIKGHRNRPTTALGTANRIFLGGRLGAADPCKRHAMKQMGDGHTLVGTKGSVRRF
jgi:hypothetical protein